MKKKISLLIDELSITNCKIFSLVDKVSDSVPGENNAQVAEWARKLQILNSYRAELSNALNEAFGERKDIKV